MIKKYHSEIALFIAYSLFIISALENSLLIEFTISNIWLNALGTAALGYSGFLLVEYLRKKGIKQINAVVGIIIGTINSLTAFGLAYLLGNIFNSYYRITQEFSIPLPYFGMGLSILFGYLATTPLRKYIPLIVFAIVLAKSLIGNIFDILR